MGGSADGAAGAPSLPEPTYRIPLGWLWAIPFALVAAYLLVVHQFMAPQARWATRDLPSIAILLFMLLGLYSVVWFAAAYLGAFVLGEWVPVVVGWLLGWIPGAGRQIIVTPPTRPDTRKEVWGRFGILWGILLGIELIFLVLIERGGALNLNLTAYHPLVFFTDEIEVGLLLAVAIAPAAPFLAARLRVRIIDTLPFPYLWLGLVVLVLGGTTVAIVAVLPGATLDPRLFLVSLLIYAPVAWYLALAFSWGESTAQRRFLRRAWAFRSSRFHFGRLQIRDEPSGEVHDA